MNIKWAFITVVLMVSFPVIGRSSVNADGDWQFWTHEGATFKISDHISASGDAVFRFGDDMSKLWYQHYDIGVTFKVTDWLSIKPAYRLKLVDVDKIPGDRWQSIDDPSINFLFSHKIGKVQMKNNCRFSYWIFDDTFNRKDLLYYRNIFKVVGPWSWTSAQIKPYVQEDFFFNCNIHELDTSRLSVGVLVNQSRVGTPSLYVMWQAYNKNGLSSSSNTDNYVVGLKFKFKF